MEEIEGGKEPAQYKRASRQRSVGHRQSDTAVAPVPVGRCTFGSQWIHKHPNACLYPEQRYNLAGLHPQEPHTRVLRTCSTRWSRVWPLSDEQRAKYGSNPRRRVYPELGLRNARAGVSPHSCLEMLKERSPDHARDLSLR